MHSDKNSLLIQLLKLIGVFIISYFLVLVIFASATTGEEIPEKYNGPMTLAAISIAFFSTLILDFNAVSRLKSLLDKTKMDIRSVDETSNALIDKAERVVKKYRRDEIEFYKEFAARKETKRIYTSRDFKAAMEAYPELQANIHTKKLLNQIEMTEKVKLNVKLNYTNAVAQYNAKIHSFPVVMLRRICKWEDMDAELALSKDELVSDAELGI